MANTEETDTGDIAGSEDGAQNPGFAGSGTGNEDQALEEIRQTLDEISLGFDFKVLDVLDDERARPANIEALKDQLGELVSARLFSVANSNYYGKIRSGKITRFVDVVMHLGTDVTKSMAIFIALMALADSEEMKVVFARSYATSKMAELLASRLGLSGAERSTLALGGLFVEMGKIIISIYARTRGEEPSADFIERHHAAVGALVIEKFELPSVLVTLVNHQYFSFVKKDNLSLSAILDLAHALVERSFSRHGKLVVQSAMPDPEGFLYTSTAGSMLAGQFQAIGLGAYLQVVSAELTEQEKRLYEKRSGEAQDR